MSEKANPFDWHPISQTPDVVPPDRTYRRLEFRLDVPDFNRRQQFVDFVRARRRGLGSGATFSSDHSIVDVESVVFGGVLQVLRLEVFEQYMDEIKCRFQ